MAPWAPILIILTIWINYVSAVALRPRFSPGEELQDEKETYLRALTQPQLTFNGPLQSAVKNMDSQLILVPPDKDLKQPPEYPSEVQQPWLVDTGIANSYAASSVLPSNPVKKQKAKFDANAIAYSSIHDVESEEFLDEAEDLIQSGKEPEKTDESVQEHLFTVPDALARKSDLTTLQLNSGPMRSDAFSDIYFVAIVAGCSAAGIFGVISAGFCFYKLQKTNKASAEVDYPAYGVTGPNKDTVSPSGDRKLAQSAQMYHYQHQKQQMIAVEKAGSTKNTSASDIDSEEENEEGDYTVYECPGLAPTGEMEVKNPLFNDDSTPMSPPALAAKSENIQSK